MAALCFDIGGTSIKYGIVERREIFSRGSAPTPTEDCRNTIPALLSGIIRQHLENSPYSIDGIGIASAGQIDSVSGRVVFATENLPDYIGTPLKEITESRFGLPCAVDNDVNAAALGEHLNGCAAGADSFILLNLGTGIGGAVVQGGQLLRGQTGIAGEIGHMIINQNGLPCTCGARGCFEQYASTGALLRAYSGLTGRNIDGVEIMERVFAGEAQAVSVFEAFLDSLAAGIAGLVHILDPGLVVIGGGISRAGSALTEPLGPRLEKLMMPSFREHTRVTVSALGNDAPLIGMAACLE